MVRSLLRRLFEVTRLTVRTRQGTDSADIEIRLPAAHLSDAADAAQAITEHTDTAGDAEHADVQTPYVPPTGFEPALPP